MSEQQRDDGPTLPVVYTLMLCKTNLVLQLVRARTPHVCTTYLGSSSSYHVRCTASLRRNQTFWSIKTSSDPHNIMLRRRTQSYQLFVCPSYVHDVVQTRRRDVRRVSQTSQKIYHTKMAAVHFFDIVDEAPGLSSRCTLYTRPMYIGLVYR